MLNGNGRAEQDFWSIAADEWPNPLLDSKWQNSMEVDLASNICEKWQKSMEIAFGH